MRKFLLALILTIGLIPFAYAKEAADIKIRINGAISDNRYFLCLPEVGCLSIMKAKQGKIYPIFRPVEMRGIYVVNTRDFRLHAQGLPKSCNVTVNPNQTITISGALSKSGDKIKINQLRCAVS